MLAMYPNLVKVIYIMSGILIKIVRDIWLKGQI